MSKSLFECTKLSSQSNADTNNLVCLFECESRDRHRCCANCAEYMDCPHDIHCSKITLCPVLERGMEEDW